MLKYLKRKVKSLLSNNHREQYKVVFNESLLSAQYYIFVNASNYLEAYNKLTSSEKRYVQFIEDECGDRKTVNEILNKKVLLKL
jgi:hypothetical protein